MKCKSNRISLQFNIQHSTFNISHLVCRAFSTPFIYYLFLRIEIRSYTIFRASGSLLLITSNGIWNFSEVSIQHSTLNIQHFTSGLPCLQHSFHYYLFLRIEIRSYTIFRASGSVLLITSNGIHNFSALSIQHSTFNIQHFPRFSYLCRQNKSNI